MYHYVHERLMGVGNKLGYRFTEHGMCQGVTMRWLEAGLVGQEDKFDARIKYITTGVLDKYASRVELLQDKMSENKPLDYSEKQFMQFLSKELDDEGTRLLKDIDRVRDKVKRHIPIDANEADLLEIPSFFESISIYSKPDRFPEVFGVSLRQQDIDKLSTFAGSDAVEGGLMTVYSEPMIATDEEIQAYLRELAQAIQDAEYPQTVGFILTEFSHSMGLSYNPTSNEWRFFDINRMPPLTSIKEIAAMLVETAPPYIAMNVRAMIPAHSLGDPLPLQAALNQVKERHVVTDEMAQRRAGVNCLTIAAQHGHVDFVTQLCEHASDLNTREQRCTPLFIAAQEGHLDCCKVLVAHGADINQVDKRGLHPVWSAVQAGEVDTVNWLLEQGAEVAPREMTVHGICQIGYALEDKRPDLEPRFGEFFNSKIRPKLENKSKVEASKVTFSVLPQDIAFIMGNDALANQIQSGSLKDRLILIKNSRVEEEPGFQAKGPITK